MLALYSIFFFFKQKTAYEMRISDWSSDVCSSDLSGGTGQFRGGLGQDICFVSVHSKPMSIVFLTERLKVPAPGIGGGSHGALGDRKSVVSGKSVSVRVDLGGRRIIEKKTNNPVLHKQHASIDNDKSRRSER